ncbi:MAG: lactate racemase domain-containing protein [Phycisphaerae bacterium]
MSSTSVIGTGGPQESLSQAKVREIIAQAVGRLAPDGKSILAIIPDHTRTCPLPMFLRELHSAVGKRAKRLDFLVALGTHPPMSDSQIDHLLGVPDGKRGEVFPGVKVFNHTWKDPKSLARVGSLSADRINEISGGLFSMDVEVTVNKLIFDYDIVLIVGPVFPHEVVGFSGGCKYFFPGISGPELLNFFHWLGAVITNPRIIGTKHTPVRAVVDAAGDMLKVNKYAFCMVVRGEELAGLYFDEPKAAWSAAADLSDKIHIIYVEKPFSSVLSKAPKMYDDLWTGGKCMYKMEPVVADGGELIIYAPHITEISVTHGAIIEEIGYHVRDYFRTQWDKFKHYPWGVLAHSTHVRGIGTMTDGVEKPRIRVTLATGIPEALCRKINLGYRDVASIRVEDWQGKESQGRLYVPKAGEMLYKLQDPPAWQKF